MEKLYNIFCTLLSVFAVASAYAEPQNYMVLDNGYRWDRTSFRASIGGPTIAVKESTLTLKRIQSYQLGAKGQLTYCNAFVRASGHYGWVGDAKYDEAGFLGKAVGNTWDVQTSLGYNFNLNQCLSIAPVVGWSYDKFQLKGKHIHVAIEGVVFHLSDIKAHQRFQGPFVGFEVLLQPTCFLDVLLGYEWHYAYWHADRIIQGPEYGNPPFGTTTGFSNKHHLDGVKGNVFNLDTSYRFCECWEAGLQLKYQFYRGDFGKYKRTRTPLISSFTYAHVDDVEWHSFAAMIHVGLVF